MKLERAVIISDEKIKKYLLQPKKRNDKSKWLAIAGYTLKNWEQLKSDLQNQILLNDVFSVEETKYGTLYEIKGELTGPNGITLKIRSFWMKEFESNITKFITLYPDKT